jgi:cobalt-zinc-cadmium efflux system protein
MHTNPQNNSNNASRRLIFALVITAAFVAIEAVAGYFANSLALLTDAVHNVTDVVALGLAWYALRVTALPAHPGKTFGYHRAGILAALVNSSALFLIALGIFYQAYLRLMTPPAVNADILIAVSAVALVVNAGTAWLVRRGREKDLNLQAAFLHLASDALATLGALIAGIGIAATGAQALDPLASMIIGALILWSAWGIVRESVSILLESTPRDIDMGALVRDLERVPGVQSIHDLHVWSISSDLRAMSAHVLTEEISVHDAGQIQRAINAVLAGRFRITHATLQLECEGCEPQVLFCELNGRPNTLEREIPRRSGS